MRRAKCTTEDSEVEKEGEKDVKKENTFKWRFEGVLFVCFRLLPAHFPCVLGAV